MDRLAAWLDRHWVAAAAFMAGALLAVFPVVAATAPLAVALIFLCSPAYMAHQVEEHAGDRFRLFVNARLFGGLPAMTRGDVLVVNLPLVWGMNLLSLWAAAFAAPGWGLLAGYAMLLNGLGHVGVAARLRFYNPGLATAVFLFLPLGLGAVAAAGRAPATTWGQHLLALALALALHALIAAHALRRAAAARRLARRTP